MDNQNIVKFVVPVKMQTNTLIRLMSEVFDEPIEPSRKALAIACREDQFGRFMVLRCLRGQDENWTAPLEPRLIVNGKAIPPGNHYDVCDNELR